MSRISHIKDKLSTKSIKIDKPCNTASKPSISVFTLGCKTNLYESQQIVSSLKKSGYNADFGLIFADIYVINTCAITKEAESKSRQAISRAKKVNPKANIIMVGCAVDKDAEQFLQKEGVIAVVNNADKEKLAQIIDSLCSNSNQKEFFGTFLPEYHHTIDAEPSHTRAFIKIQDGCNNYCSYCIVPYLRGRSRSRTIESIVNEVKSNSETKEFVLIGIDISQYGNDIGVTLADLLSALDFTSARIRFGSIYQDCINDALLTTMKTRCKHFHLSLQSGCDKTLRDMNRHYTTAEYKQKVDLIRSFYPDTAITTDVIVGFCGETEQDFAQTCAFVEEIAFADIHIFPYSPREGTAAYGKQTPDSTTVSKRVARLTEIKQKLHKSFLCKYLGKTMQILTEERKNGYTIGLTDNYIKVYVADKLPINTLVDVRICELHQEGVIGVVEP